MRPMGQEKVVDTAGWLLDYYANSQGEKYQETMKELMGQMLPMFPHVANAVAVYPLVKEMLEDYQATGKVSEELLLTIWDEIHLPPVGRA